LQKVTIGFVMPVCLSVHPSECNYFAPTGWIFMKFDVLFSKIYKEKVSLKRVRTDGYFT